MNEKKKKLLKNKRHLIKQAEHEISKKERLVLTVTSTSLFEGNSQGRLS